MRQSHISKKPDSVWKIEKIAKNARFIEAEFREWGSVFYACFPACRYIKICKNQKYYLIYLCNSKKSSTFAGGKAFCRIEEMAKSKENTCNSLIVSNLRMRMGGGKNEPLRMLVAAVAAVILCACAPKPNSQSYFLNEYDSVFQSRDSLLWYASRAYMYDDAKGQFVTGAAPYLQREGKVPDWIYTLPLDQADTMLMMSAQQGFEPAVAFIGVLVEEGKWKHEW